MKLIVITPSSTIEDEHYILSKILDMGLTTLHVRKPKLSKRELGIYLKGFTKSQQKKIILHTHYGLMWNFDLKGIHVSKRQRKKRFKFTLRKIMLYLRRGKFQIGASCESFQSLNELYKDFDYIFIYPVFPGLNGHLPGINMGSMKKILPSYPEKVIAKGGTAPDNIGIARKLGFSGIAFQEYLWDYPEPLISFQKILDTFREEGLTIE